MDCRRAYIVEAEHHFDLSGDSSEFELETGLLHPYLVTQGSWRISPLYFASLGGPLTEDRGFKLLCYQTLSGSDKPLALFYLGSKEFEDKNRTVTFDQAHKLSRSLPITRKSDRLYFELRTLEGKKVKLAKDQKVRLGLAVLQVS